MTGRAVSTRWIRTCLSKSLPFSAGSDRDQLLFCHGQDPFESDDEKIADQIGVNILGPATHVLLFEARDSFAHGGFDFSLSLHTHLARARIPSFIFRWQFARLRDKTWENGCYATSSLHHNLECRQVPKGLVFGR